MGTPILSSVDLLGLVQTLAAANAAAASAAAASAAAAAAALAARSRTRVFTVLGIRVYTGLEFIEN